MEREGIDTRAKLANWSERELERSTALAARPSPGLRKASRKQGFHFEATERLAPVAECGATPQDDTVLHSLLDRSIVFSYDRSGFRRHAARFIAGELETDQRGRVAVVTGASSGIGIEVARGLLLRGADTTLCCSFGICVI